MKKMLSLICAGLLAVLLCSCGGTGELTENYAHITFADAGELISSGETVLAAQKVALKDLNGDGTVDVDEVIREAHERFYEGGRESGYATYDGGYGTAIAKFWGDESGAYGYWRNDDTVWNLEDPVAEGDRLTVFIYKDSAGFSDSYAYFTEKEITIKAGESERFTLMNAGYDENWMTVFAPTEGAGLRILGDDAGQTAVTDADGTASLRFEKAGKYTVIAEYEGIFENGMYVSAPLVPAICTVTVNK